MKDNFKRRMEHTCLYCSYNNPNQNHRCVECIHNKDKISYTDRLNKLKEKYNQLNESYKQLKECL